MVPMPSSASTTCVTTWSSIPDSRVQRGHEFAIVDEVDSILIDEARTPLIISGAGSQSTETPTTSSPMRSSISQGR